MVIIITDNNLWYWDIGLVNPGCEMCIYRWLILVTNQEVRAFPKPPLTTATPACPPPAAPSAERLVSLVTRGIYREVGATHQDPARGGLARDELAGPVLGLRHPADLRVRVVLGRPAPLGRVAHLGDGRRLPLAAQPGEDAPGEHEQQPDEEGDE